MSTQTDSELAYNVRDVHELNVNGARFVEFSYGAEGKTSVLIEREDAVDSLFASADSEFQRAREISRRAMRTRNAAWALSKARTVRTALATQAQRVRDGEIDEEANK